MEIGLFQLENLALTPAHFRIFDLRAKREPVHPGLDRLLKAALNVAPDQVIKCVQSERLPLDLPLILVCEDGGESSKLVVQLEALGHINVYFVGGGVNGLLSEL